MARAKLLLPDKVEVSVAGWLRKRGIEMGKLPVYSGSYAVLSMPVTTFSYFWRLGISNGWACFIHV